MPPPCPYCNEASELVTGAVLYPHRPRLAAKRFYRCEPCGAWVGCHDGTDKPMGRLANLELRKAKQLAHNSFDRLWKAKMRRDRCSKNKARYAAYNWLAEQLGIDREACHIGMFDVDLCRRTVERCKPFLARGS